MDKEDEDEDYYAPIVPPPRKTRTIPLDSEELSQDILNKIEKTSSFMLTSAHNGGIEIK